MRGNCFKMDMVKFKFDIRNKLFAMKVVKYWNKLPSVMDATSLELFEISLYGALSNWTVQDVPAFGWEFALDNLSRSSAAQSMTKIL